MDLLSCEKRGVNQRLVKWATGIGPVRALRHLRGLIAPPCRKAIFHQEKKWRPQDRDRAA
jgi:hypothetical protein